MYAPPEKNKFASYRGKAEAEQTGIRMEPKIIVKRHPFEEPYHLQLEFFVSNGSYSGHTDIYCNAEDLKTIGRALRNFPSKIDDEYRYELGSENPEDRWHLYFLMRAYTTDSVGHCAIQFAISINGDELNESSCRFSIAADAASINRLGVLFEKFSKLEEFEFEWSPELSG